MNILPYSSDCRYLSATSYEKRDSWPARCFFNNVAVWYVFPHGSQVPIFVLCSCKHDKRTTLFRHFLHVLMFARRPFFMFFKQQHLWCTTLVCIRAYPYAQKSAWHTLHTNHGGETDARGLWFCSDFCSSGTCLINVSSCGSILTCGDGTSLGINLVILNSIYISNIFGIFKQADMLTVPSSDIVCCILFLLKHLQQIIIIIKNTKMEERKNIHVTDTAFEPCSCSECCKKNPTLGVKKWMFFNRLVSYIKTKNTYIPDSIPLCRFTLPPQIKDSRPIQNASVKNRGLRFILWHLVVDNTQPIMATM